MGQLGIHVYETHIFHCFLPFFQKVSYFGFNFFYVGGCIKLKMWNSFILKKTILSSELSRVLFLFSETFEK